MFKSKSDADERFLSLRLVYIFIKVKLKHFAWRFQFECLSFRHQRMKNRTNKINLLHQLSDLKHPIKVLWKDTTFCAWFQFYLITNGLTSCCKGRQKIKRSRKNVKQSKFLWLSLISFSRFLASVARNCKWGGRRRWRKTNRKYLVKDTSINLR